MASKPDDDDVLTCPICFEHFTYPKNLPCNHTFCKLCWKSYIETRLGEESQQSEPGKTFPCPVCRQTVNVGHNMSAEKIADDMPSNRLVMSLIERTQSSGKKQSETYCDPCVLDDQKQIASSWCTSCSEALCKNCTSYHRRFKQTKNHIMIPIDDVPKDEATSQLDVEEPCMKHSDKVLEVYCEDHKEMCCVICLATSHRKCEHIATFEEMATGPELKANVKTFQKSLKQVETKTSKLRIDTEERLHKLDNTHGDIMQQTSSMIKEAKDKLDRLQSEFVTKFKQTHKGEMVKLTERQERLEAFEKCVKKGQNLLNVVENQGSLKQLFITKEKLKMQLKDHMDILKNYLEETTYYDYTLKIDAVLTSLVKSLPSVAEIEEKPSLEFSLEMNKALDMFNKSCSEDTEDETHMNMDVIRLTVSKIFNISLPVCSWTTDFSGGTFLSDGRMVLCYKDLRVYDKDMNYLFATNCLHNGHPLDACCVSSCNIIVAVSRSEFLQKFEVTDTGFIDKGTIQCEIFPFGLAASRNYIVVGGQRRVDILTLDGQFLKTISSRQGGELSYVAISQDHVYFNDSGNRVLCKNLKGELIKKISHPKLRNILGMTVDRYGNVFVIGCESRNVVVFSADGTQSKVIIDADIDTPEGIGFDPTGTQFFLAMGPDVHLYTVHYV